VEEGGKVDVIFNKTPREEGSLLRADGRAECHAEPCGEDAAKDAVYGVKKGDGSVGRGGGD
jgi:hypothetical protein